MVFSGGVRAQVFEVIVRQAMAGAPWREICAGPMQVNNITAEEVEVEVARRRGQGLQCFSKEQIEVLDAYIAEWRDIVDIKKPDRAHQEQALSNLERDVRPFINNLYQTMELPPPAVAICESPAKRVLYEYALALLQPGSSLSVSFDDVADDVLSNLSETQKSDYLTDFQNALSHLRESGLCNPGPSLSDRLQDHFFNNLQVEIKGRIREMLKFDPNHYLGAGFNFRIEPIFERLRTVFDITFEELPYEFGQQGNQPSVLAGGAARVSAQFAIASGFSLIPAVNAALVQSTWGVWKTDLILGAGFLKERMPELGGFPDPCDSELKNWLSMFRLAPWYAFCQNICYVGAYPTEATFSDTNRLNNDNGPAVTFADGWKVWALDGIRCPRKLVEAPETITAQEIQTTTNVALRRMMLESFGAARFLQESNSRLIHKDEHGELYQQDMPGDEPLTMLRVINSTPEPDGTYKDYFLRVPPFVRTAKEAVAWTFDMNAAEYKPEKET